MEVCAPISGFSGIWSCFVLEVSFREVFDGLEFLRAMYLMSKYYSSVILEVFNGMVTLIRKESIQRKVLFFET